MTSWHGNAFRISISWSLTAHVAEFQNWTILLNFIITRSFSPDYSQHTAHSPPVRTRYGLWFVSSYLDLYTAFVICDIIYDRPCYKDTPLHYNDVMIGAMASQITSLTTVYSTVHSGTDERKHQSSASLAFVQGIHQCPVNSPHKGPVTRKMFPFDDVIMVTANSWRQPNENYPWTPHPANTFHKP